MGQNGPYFLGENGPYLSNIKKIVHENIVDLSVFLQIYWETPHIKSNDTIERMIVHQNVLLLPIQCYDFIHYINLI